MTPLFFIVYVIYIACSVSQSKIGEETISPHCDGHQANYHKQDVMGSWYVVALVPGVGFPKLKHVACYKMELSETDEAGVRWLVKKKIRYPSQDFIRKLTGTIIRQRFHSEKPFDIWSKGYYSARGCFRQLLSLETNNTNVADGEYYENYMQLHLIETHDGVGPYLVQVLWGRLISAIVYRRATGVSMEGLEPIMEFLYKMRGYTPRQPRICDLPLKVIPPPAFQRP